jgi:excisionase family DNA binding protein
LERLVSNNPNLKYIGYVETSISMAGWGVAWACKLLGLQAVIYDPQYKETPKVLAYHRERWSEFNVIIRPIKAGMAKVNWNICRNSMRDEFGDSGVLLPLGLLFPETIEATRQEAVYTRDTCGVDFRTIVINVGSGTIAAGVVSAYSDTNVHIVGVCGRPDKSPRLKRLRLLAKGPGLGQTSDRAQEITPRGFGLFDENLLSVAEAAKYLDISTTTVVNWTDLGWLRAELISGRRYYRKKIYPFQFDLIDNGWEYTQRSYAPCPFPCHPYYDRKAWEWLIKNQQHISYPVLFWNIGH